MSQHDFDIANQTASVTRSDLNLALKALASQSSGTSAPATTYANMMWYDTTNNLLRMRNESNTTWITLGTLDQVANTFAANVAIASQAEAEAGTNNTKVMTALRTKQAITATVSSSPVEFLATADASGDAVLDFTYDPTVYGTVFFELTNVRPSTNVSVLNLQGSINTGTTFPLKSDWVFSGIRTSGVTTATNINAEGAQSGSLVEMTTDVGNNGTTRPGVSGRVHLNHSDAAFEACGATWSLRYKDGLAVGFLHYVEGASQWETTSIVDAVRFKFSSGNIASGTITMYGIRNS